MEGILHNISLGIMFFIVSYGIGVAVRYSPDIRLGFGYVFGFVLFGTTLNAVFFGSGVQLVPPVSTFIWVSVFAGPLGFITAPLIIDHLSIKTESFLGSAAFDKTYRKYTQSKKKRNDNFRWYDERDYQKDHKQSYGQAGGGFGGQWKRSKSQYSSSPNAGGSQKDKMFKILGLVDQTLSAAEIKSAYRKLARKYHPDALASQNLSESDMDQAMKRMQDINLAYEWLEDNGFA